MGIQRTSSGWDIRKSLLGKEGVFLAKEEASWDTSTLQVVRACGHLWSPVPGVLSEPRFLSRAVNSFKIKDFSDPMGSGHISARGSRFSPDSADVSSSSSVSFSKEGVWQAGQERDLETEACIHSCDLGLHNASLVTAALPGTACSCAIQLCSRRIRQEGCFHWGIPLSTPRERAGEQGRETGRAVTDEGILRLLASAL